MTAPYVGSKWLVSGGFGRSEAIELISCDPNIARILNPSSRHFELDQFARLEMNGAGGAWMSASANGLSRARRGPAAKLHAGVAAILAIFR